MATRPRPQQPPRKVINYVFQNFFSPGELLHFRPVCKEWAYLIEDKCSDNIILKVDSDPESIKSFRSLHSTLKPRHIRLANLDWIGNGPGGHHHHDVYNDLTLHHCRRLESLQLESCQLVTVTFLQLISSCPNLKSIGVASCPMAYNGSENMLNWGLNPLLLNSTLSGLTKLELAEACIPEKDLGNLTFEMKSLRVVRIFCNDRVILPRYAIINILSNNCDNLEELTLGGRFFGDISAETEDDVGARLEQLPMLMALRSLSLLRCHFNTFERGTVFHTLFQKCQWLSRLQISKARLDHVSFAILEESLTQLEIGECSLSRSTFVDAKLGGLRKLKVIPEADVYTDELEESVVKLLRKGLPLLETLQLKLVTGGQSYMGALEPSKFPRLVNLTLNGFPDVLGPPLRQLFKSFPGLKSLALTNNEDLVDGNLCPGTDGKMESSIGNLKELHYLSLIGTSIKNRTLVECLPLMKKLECLRLDGTGVDRPGLGEVFAILGVSENYPAFRYITLTSCDNCRLSIEEIGILKVMAPHVNIACSIDISELRPSK